MNPKELAPLYVLIRRKAARRKTMLGSVRILVGRKIRRILRTPASRPLCVVDGCGFHREDPSTLCLMHACAVPARTLRELLTLVKSEGSTAAEIDERLAAMHVAVLSAVSRADTN
jgi:hypothetical protein